MVVNSVALLWPRHGAGVRAGVAVGGCATYLMHMVPLRRHFERVSAPVNFIHSFIKMKGTSTSTMVSVF